jgi:pSer/pThr/pTyr-binding forkhead associated (FHA) protein
MAILTVVAGDERGRQVVLPKSGTIIIGRANADVVFNDGRLSRKHCSIAKTQDGYVLRDLNSTNGVFVNGQRVQEVLLRYGDKLRLGYTVLEFQDEDELAPLEPPEEKEETEAVAPAHNTLRRKPPGKSRIMAAKFAAMGKEPLTESRRLISAKGRFCEACSAVISPDDLDAKRARRIDGYFLCQSCAEIAETKKIAPKNIPKYLKLKEQERKATEPNDETGKGLEPIK